MTNTRTGEGEGGAILAEAGVETIRPAHRVIDDLEAGSILIAEGAPLPAAVRLRADTDSIGWSAVKEERLVFTKEAQEAGLTFFYMAGEIKTTVFGFDRPKSLRRGLKRLIAKVGSQDCNALQITQITRNSFLKLPYVSLYAHARHLQKGPIFLAQR